ncbi:Mif2/CENP-C like-domain-containing protein [Hypoxylon trugodes]|uniref:Mif2/CENP-C like-domain-containing protein n=1 Tax=Hypoxylon trugodes TaxID=326681 RepID=UPI002191C3B6|nr:Mif2/CENP-C like-domain-containing protein [Hypoxylon trugodes]KAI1388280.1 Mif2/CENP-C like-domain-containing protein [Hypoxylon trugodes]
MPPKQSSQRRMTQSQSQNEQVYDLGVHGRKTGLTLPERQRDEHGFEDHSGLFSSPEKDVNNPTANGTNGVNGRHHEDSDGEQDMEIDDESQIGPATAMKQQRQTHRPSLPRARSPIKTHLQSPARQNPYLGPTSSPARGSIVTAREREAPKTVNRRLDFSQGSQSRGKPQANGVSKVNGTKGRNGKLTNGRARSSESDDEEAIMRGMRNRRQEEPEEEDEEDPEEAAEGEEESMQIIDAGNDDFDDVPGRDESPVAPEPEPEEEEEEQIQQAKSSQQPKKRRGRKPKSPVAQEEEEPSIVEPSPAQAKAGGDPSKKKQRGRPGKAAQPAEEPEPPKPSKRRRSGRNSGSSANEGQEEQEEEDNVANEKETKRQRTEKKGTKASSKPIMETKEKTKPGRKRKSSGVGVDEPIVQRGPPLPKGRGLVALRREEDDDIMRVTRSGRHSYKPLEFWKGEHVIYDEARQEIFDDKDRRFMMPAVKGVMRVADDYRLPKRRRGRPAKKSSRGSYPSVVYERERETIERDPWESDPGRIAGECLYWRGEQPQEGDELEIVEEELAISEAAIQLKDIKDATFKFAKTLTMPFFGSGIVDMPPGSEKRTKNSRKMQMVFFVHTGSVDVVVAQTEFRIGKGGMWFVPRGNHYSITNNTDNPARIFFAQGCEMAAPVDDEGPQE